MTVLGLSVLLMLAPVARAGPWEPPTLPTEPAPPVEREDDCPEQDLRPGQPATLDCRGQVISVGQYDALAEWIEDDRAVRRLHQVSVLQLAVERDAALREAEAARPRWYERPAVVLPVGVLLGAGAVLGGAWAMGEVGR
jgi:hypothetical protein